MNERLSELYNILKQSKDFSTTFKDENELGGMLSTEQGVNDFYNALDLSEEFKGMFKDSVEFSNTFQLKKKVSAIESAAKGETIFGTFGQPPKESITPKLPFQQVKQPPKEPLTYEATQPKDYTLASMAESGAKMTEFYNEQIKNLEEELITKAKSIADTSETQEEFDKNIKSLTDEYNKKGESVIDNIESFKYLDYEDTKVIKEELASIMQSSDSFVEKNQGIENLISYFVEQAPESVQGVLRGELNRVVAKETMTHGSRITPFAAKTEALKMRTDVESKSVPIRKEWAVLATKKDRTGAETEKMNELSRQLRMYGQSERLLGMMENLPDDQGSFIQGLAAPFKDGTVQSLGITDVTDAITRWQASKKVGNLEGTDADKSVLAALGLFEVGQQDLGTWYKRGAGLSETLPFMAQFALTSPLVSGLTATAKKATTEVLKQTFIKKAAQFTLKSAVQAGIRAPLLTTGIERAFRGMTGEPVFDAETGTFTIDQSTKEGILEASVKGLATNFMEAFFESGGEAVGKGVNALTGRLGIKIPKKAPWLVKTQNAVMFNGWLGESIEEFPTGFFQDLLIEGKSFSESWENLKEATPDILFTTAVISGVFGGLSAPGGIADIKQSKRLAESLGTDNLAKIDESAKTGNKESFKKIIDEVWASLPKEKQTEQTAKDLIRYTGLSLYEQAANTAQAGLQGEVTDKGLAVTEVGALTVPKATPEEIAGKTVFPEGFTPEVKIRTSGNDRIEVRDNTTDEVVSSFALKTKVIDGVTYWEGGSLQTHEDYQGKGLGQNVLKLAMESMPEGYDGLYFPNETIHNDTQIPHIFEKLGGIYDVTKSENGDVFIKPKIEIEGKEDARRKEEEDISLAEEVVPEQVLGTEVVDGIRPDGETGVEAVTGEEVAKLEKEMGDIENKLPDEKDSVKYDALQERWTQIEKILENKEKSDVFNTPLEKVNDVLDDLLKKEEEMPNGYGTFADVKDLRESKEVVDKYLDAESLTDAEIMKDFVSALRGRPTTWYADGLKLRESAKEASNRGITFETLIDKAKQVYTKEGYTDETALSVVKGFLDDVFKGATKPKMKIGTGEEVTFTQFEDIVKQSKTVDEAFTKAQEIKDVSPEISEAFRNKYDPDKTLTPKQSFEKFYNEIKAEKEVIQPEITPEEVVVPITEKVEEAPPKPPITPTEEEIPIKDERDKRLLNRFKKAENLSEPFKEHVSRSGLTYEGIPNDVTVADVDNLIANKGLDESEKAVYNTRNDIPARTRNLAGVRIVAALDTLADEAFNEGDLKAEAEYRLRAVEMAEFIDEASREMGRGIQILGSLEAMATLAPKTAVIKAKREVRRQRDEKLKENKKDITKKAKSMRKATEESIDEAMKSKIYDKARRGVTGKVRIVPDVNVGKEKIAKEQAYIKTQWDVFKQASKDITSVSAIGLNSQQIEAVGNIIGAYIRMGYYRTEVLVGKLIQDWKKNTGTDLTEEEAIKLLPKEIEGKKLADLQEEGQKLDASTRLSNRIERMLKDTKVPKDDPVKQMIDTLFKKVEEKDTKEKVKPQRKSDIEKIRDSIENKEEYADVWEDAKDEIQRRIDTNPILSDAQKKEYTDRLQGFYDEVIGKPFTEKQIEGAVKKKIKDLDIAIDKVVKDHYTIYDATKRTLQEKLIDELGLTGEDAKMIADAVGTEFDKIALKRKRIILKRGVTPREIAQPKKAKETWEKLIELSNLGAFSDTEFAEAYADKWGFPKLTDDQTKEIERLANKVYKAPEGYKKYEAIQDLLAYQASIPGIDIGDYAMGLWYSAILSGYRTQFKNVFANTMNTLAELTVSGIRHPTYFPRLVKGLATGLWRGGYEFMYIMKKGYTPIRGFKIETPAMQEQVKLSKWNPIGWAKYVPRFMWAADAFTYAGLKEMRAYEMALTGARKLNKLATTPTMSTWAKATELLNNTSLRRTEAEQQTEEEGLKGIEKKKRIWELMEQGRDKKMIEDSVHFAAHGTFNYPPEGMIGFMTEMISSLTQGAAMRFDNPFTSKRVTIRPLKFVIPFTRIIANVANTALDYYPPIGLARVASGGIGFKAMEETRLGQGKYREYTPEERQKIAIKMMIGVAAQVGFYLLTEPPEDGSEPFFEVTANGTGDYAKNYELKEQGWQQYSIRIGKKWYSYQYTPLVLALAPLGFYRDLQKYSKEKISESTMAGLIAISYFKSLRVMNDMTWATSLTSLMDAFNSGEPNQTKTYLQNLAVSTAKGAIYPKLIEQTVQRIDALQENPRKEAQGYIGKLTRDIPIVRNKYNVMLNAVGEPVFYDPIQMLSDVKKDVFWEYLENNDIFIGKPSAKEIIYDDINKVERGMTDDEYFDFVSKTGKEIKRRIMDEVMPNDMNKDEITKAVTNIKTEVRQQARVEMFGWGDFRSLNSEGWGLLKKNGAVQIPVTTPITWMTDDGKVKATEEEMVTYNNTAMKYYFDEMVDYLKADAEFDKKEIDETTGIIVYESVIDDIWQGARDAAKGDIIDEREKKPKK